MDDLPFQLLSPGLCIAVEIDDEEPRGPSTRGQSLFSESRNSESHSEARGVPLSGIPGFLGSAAGSPESKGMRARLNFLFSLQGCRGDLTPPEKPKESTSWTGVRCLHSVGRPQICVGPSTNLARSKSREPFAAFVSCFLAPRVCPFGPLLDPGRRKASGAHSTKILADLALLFASLSFVCHSAGDGCVFWEDLPKPLGFSVVSLSDSGKESKTHPARHTPPFRT